MKISKVARRAVAVVSADRTLREAAHLMREGHLGALVVVDAESERPRPTGVITDRDLVVSVFGADLETSVDDLLVGDLSLGEVHLARADEDMLDVVRRMSAAGVRRVPVVDPEDGALIGIFTMDDALSVLTRELQRLTGGLGDLVRLVPTQADREAAHRG